MTGLFIRLKRNGQWQSIDLAEATPEERHAFFCTLPPPALVRWLGALCEVLDKQNRAALVARASHWVATWRNPASWLYVFDVNGGIRLVDEWEKEIVPLIVQSIKRADGTFTVSHSWVIKRA